MKIQKEEKQGIFHDQHTWPHSAEALFSSPLSHLKPVSDCLQVKQVKGYIYCSPSSPQPSQTPARMLF